MSFNIQLLGVFNPVDLVFGLSLPLGEENPRHLAILKLNVD